MRSVADLQATASQPGCRLFMSSVVVAGREQAVPQPQGTPTRVVEVCQDAIHLENGNFLPFGCCGAYEFDGSPDRFKVRVGPAILQYEIVQGET